MARPAERPTGAGPGIESLRVPTRGCLGFGRQHRPGLRKSDRLAHGAYTRGCPLRADRDANSAVAEGGRGMVCGRHPYVGPSRGRTRTFQPDRKAPPQPTRWAVRSRRSHGYRSSRCAVGRGRSRRPRRVMLERQGKRGGCPKARRNPRPRGPWRLVGELGGSSPRGTGALGPRRPRSPQLMGLPLTRRLCTAPGVEATGLTHRNHVPARRGPQARNVPISAP